MGELAPDTEEGRALILRLEHLRDETGEKKVGFYYVWGYIYIYIHTYIYIHGKAYPRY